MVIISKELKTKIQYAGTGTALLLFWFLYFREHILLLLDKVSIPLAFFIYNSLLLLGIYLISLTFNHHPHKIATLTIVTVLILDIILPPYLVNIDGTINSSIQFYNVSTDVFVAQLLILLGLKGVFVWLATYLLVPILGLFILPVIFGNTKDIRQIFGI